MKLTLKKLIHCFVSFAFTKKKNNPGVAHEGYCGTQMTASSHWPITGLNHFHQQIMKLSKLTFMTTDSRSKNITTAPHTPLNHRLRPYEPLI